MEGRTERLSDILKDYVLERKKVNSKISESQIARNLGVPVTTFHRMLNYNAYPNVHNLLKLCKSIPKLKSLVTEELMEVTRESSTGKYIGQELERLLSKKHLFIAYALALSAHGVTDEEILYCLGYEGIKALEILMKKNFVIKKDDNKYRATETNKGIILSFEVLKRHVKIFADEYKPDNVANNYIYYKIETLNKEGMRELYKIHKETHRKVQRLMEKEEYKGDVPTFSAGFFDMFFLKGSKNKKEEQNEDA